MQDSEIPSSQLTTQDSDNASYNVSSLDPNAAIIDGQTAIFTDEGGAGGIQQKVLILQNAMPLWNPIFMRFAENYDLYHSKQWTDEEIQTQKGQGRQPLQFNKIEPVIRNILGKHGAAQQQWEISPTFDPMLQSQTSDMQVQKAELLEKALNGIADACQYTTVEEKLVFQDGIIGGIGWANVTVKDVLEDYQTLSFQWQDPREIVYDPMCRKPDLSDARWLARRVYLTIPEALLMFPDEEAQAKVRAWSRTRDPYFGLYDSEWMRIGNDLNYDQFLLPIVEFYERKYFHVFVLTDLNSPDGIKKEFGTMEDAQAEAAQRQQVYQQRIVAEETQLRQMAAEGVPPQQMPQPTQFYPLEIKSKTAQKIVQTCFIQLDYLSEKVLDQDFYPYVPYYPYFSRGKFLGFVDILRDGQKAFNRWMSQVDYILGVSAKGGHLLDETGLAEGYTPEQASEEIAKTGGIVRVKLGRLKDTLEPMDDANVNGTYAELLQITSQQFNLQYPAPAYTSAIPGSQGGAPDQSGVALHEQKASADIGTEIWFDNFLQYRRHLGEIGIFAIQHWTDKPILAQWMGAQGAAEFALLNSQTNSADSVYGERYLVAVTDIDYSPTKRSQSNAQAYGLMQLPFVQMMPPLMMATLETWLQTSDLPESFKDKLLQALATPAPPPMGANGAPSPQTNTNHNPATSPAGSPQ